MDKKAGNSKISITGKVIKGESLGKKLGFPTANLDRRQFTRLKLKPKLGIYAGWAVVQASNKSPHRRPAKNAGIKHQESRKFRAGIVIGPSDSRGLAKIEAHLIGFRGDLYQQRLALCLVQYLRPFRAFKNPRSLKKAIGRDIQAIKKLKFHLK